MNLLDVVRLPARPSDSLQWILPPTVATGSQSLIFWQFDLGLERPYVPLEDALHFQALSLALTHFSQTVWPLYKDQTLGAILYRGSADFSTHFAWREKVPSRVLHENRLFCADAFAYFFQMLAHRLPDELPLYLLLDATLTGTLAERHQIVSKERFEHFHVAVKGLPSVSGLIWEEENIQPAPTPPTALCFPPCSLCTHATLQKLDEWMTQQEGPFRVIFEPFLTEMWEGVDKLFFCPEALSPQGERKLQGFLAAGGEVETI